MNLKYRIDEFKINSLYFLVLIPFKNKSKQKMYFHVTLNFIKTLFPSSSLKTKIIRQKTFSMVRGVHGPKSSFLSYKSMVFCFKLTFLFYFIFQKRINFYKVLFFYSTVFSS